MSGYMTEQAKEFDEQCVNELDALGFYETMNKLMSICSALEDKEYKFSTSVKDSKFLRVTVTKRGPDLKIHRIV